MLKFLYKWEIKQQLQLYMPYYINSDLSPALIICIDE